MRVTRLGSVCVSLLAAWCVAASALPLFGQVAAGEITGVVKDQTGSAVPGAAVTVTNVETNRQRVVASSGDGVYAAPSLAPGKYRVDVELAGFKPMRREGIRLSTGEKARIDFDLVVGDVLRDSAEQRATYGFQFMSSVSSVSGGALDSASTLMRNRPSRVTSY